MGASLVSTSLLVRVDSRSFSLKLMQELDRPATGLECGIAFIIKWDVRRSQVEAIARHKTANAAAKCETLHPDKRECIWQESLDLVNVGITGNSARRVHRLTELTFDKNSVVQVPGYILDGWAMTLPGKFSPIDIIALYCDHVTPAQFHSKFNTDVDLERLPSGKFDTYYSLCQMAAFAMSLLRIMARNARNEADAPPRCTSKRRQIRAVKYVVMFKATRMIKHASGRIRGLGASDSGFAVFERPWRVTLGGLWARAHPIFRNTKRPSQATLDRYCRSLYLACASQWQLKTHVIGLARC